MNYISKRIRTRREELGYSQDELALKMGYKSRSSINKIESGVNDIPQSKIKAFADALYTTPSYLMGWIDDVKIKKPVEHLDKYAELSRQIQSKLYSLDEKGIHTVNTVLQMEFQRCNKINELNAAHEIESATIEDKIFDDSIMDNENNWD